MPFAANVTESVRPWVGGLVTKQKYNMSRASRSGGRLKSLAVWSLVLYAAVLTFLYANRELCAGGLTRESGSRRLLADGTEPLEDHASELRQCRKDRNTLRDAVIKLQHKSFKDSIVTPRCVKNTPPMRKRRHGKRARGKRFSDDEYIVVTEPQDETEARRIVEHNPVLQLVQAVEQLDVEKVRAIVDVHKEELRSVQNGRSTIFTWHEARYNPIFFQTGQGQNLLHLAAQACSVSDGHTVGIMAHWFNPNRLQFRSSLIQPLDQRAAKITEIILAEAPVLGRMPDFHGYTPMHLAAHVRCY